MDNCETVLGEKPIKSMRMLFTEAGLDYCGMDFTLLPEDKILVFEANPAMNSSMNKPHPTAPHLENYLLHHEQAKIRMFRAMTKLQTAATGDIQH